MANVISDAEFVERVADLWLEPGNNPSYADELARLFTLARRGAHLCGTARSLGWPDDGGEGAFEFVVRLTREVAFEDARRGAAAAAEIGRLRAALREIVLITDRKHDAWDRAKLLLGGQL